MRIKVRLLICLAHILQLTSFLRSPCHWSIRDGFKCHSYRLMCFCVLRGCVGIDFMVLVPVSGTQSTPLTLGVHMSLTGGLDVEMGNALSLLPFHLLSAGDDRLFGGGSLPYWLLGPVFLSRCTKWSLFGGRCWQSVTGLDHPHCSVFLSGDSA